MKYLTRLQAARLLGTSSAKVRDLDALLAPDVVNGKPYYLRTRVEEYRASPKPEEQTHDEQAHDEQYYFLLRACPWTFG